HLKNWTPSLRSKRYGGQSQRVRANARPDDWLRVPTTHHEPFERRWARRMRAFAHPTTCPGRWRSARRFQPLLGQKPHRGIRVHRLTEGKALRVFASQLVELDRIRIRLCALGDDVHAEIMRERDDRLQDHRARAAAGGSDKGL